MEKKEKEAIALDFDRVALGKSWPQAMSTVWKGLPVNTCPAPAASREFRGLLVRGVPSLQEGCPSPGLERKRGEEEPVRKTLKI